MRKRFLVLAGLAPWPLVAQVADAFAETTPANEVRRALESVFRDDRFQRLPPPEGSIDLPDLEWLKTAAEMAGPLANLATVLFWLFIAIVGAFLIAVIVRTIAARGRAPAAVDERLSLVSSAGDKDARRATRADAEALARAGQHAEAIHTLLLAALCELGTSGGAIAPASTSREILRTLPMLAGEAKSALGALVRAVEHTFFGGRPADASGYAACERAFDELVASLSRRAA